MLKEASGTVARNVSIMSGLSIINTLNVDTLKNKTIEGEKKRRWCAVPAVARCYHHVALWDR